MRGAEHSVACRTGHNYSCSTTFCAAKVEITRLCNIIETQSQKIKPFDRIITVLTPRARFFSLVASASLVAAAPGQPLSVNFDQPTLDRWMYPFNSTPGSEGSAPCFGAIQIAGFDDRDGQFLLGWNTAAAVPQGQPLENYRITAVHLRLTVQVDMQFKYDPTPDSFVTLLDTTDPAYLADSDPGKPVELFGAGYRNGRSASTFNENSPFGGAPIIPPAEGSRNVFPALLDEAGNATDISRQIRQRFDAPSLAIGLTGAVTPGQFVPAGTVLTFDIDLCAAANRAYIQRALTAGRLMLVVSSLQPAQGGPDGGTGTPSYPAFYTKENVIDPDFAAELDLDLIVAKPADFDGDGFITGDDFDAYVAEFEAGNATADFDHDCFVTGDDFDAFVIAFEIG